MAHSITLALAALDVLQVAAYMPEIEAAVALSITYVAVDNLVHPRLQRARWVEALGFGLIHGLAFASFLGHSLTTETAKGIALISFNAGVELGQVTFILAAVLALRLLPRKKDEEDPFLAPTWLRRSGSIAVAAISFMWFLQRI